MNHHRRVDAVERAGARHQFFAAAFLLGRRPQQRTVPHRRSRIAARPSVAPKRGRRDQVVAAGVADAGQRIVFGEQVDERAGRAAGEVALESGLEAVSGALDGEAGRRQRVAQQAARVVLVESEFRVGVDIVRHADEFPRQRIDPAHDDLFQFGGHSGAPRTAMGGPHDCRDAPGDKPEWRGPCYGLFRPISPTMKKVKGDPKPQHVRVATGDSRPQFCC